MTTSGFYKRKNFKNVSGDKQEWVGWAAWAAGGGFLASLTAHYFHQKDLAIGLGWGSVFNVLNFYSLKILTEKVLTRGEVEGQKFFWLWTPVRWVFLALACWLFLSVSPLCLAGAGASYFWFLVVLGFVSWRSSSPSEEK